MKSHSLMSLSKHVCEIKDIMTLIMSPDNINAVRKSALITSALATDGLLLNN